MITQTITDYRNNNDNNSDSHSNDNNNNNNNNTNDKSHDDNVNNDNHKASNGALAAGRWLVALLEPQSRKQFSVTDAEAGTIEQTAAITSERGQVLDRAAEQCLMSVMANEVFVSRLLCQSILHASKVHMSWITRFPITRFCSGTGWPGSILGIGAGT